MIKREELSNPNSCMSRAKDDEMIFVLLGRDAAAPHAIREWVRERIRLGKNAWSDGQIIEALTCANKIEQSLSDTEANYNPFEPPETTTQQTDRIGRMIRENVDKKMAVERQKAEEPTR
jgi:hypothetical protein